MIFLGFLNFCSFKDLDLLLRIRLCFDLSSLFDFSLHFFYLLFWFLLELPIINCFGIIPSEILDLKLFFWALQFFRLFYFQVPQLHTWWFWIPFNFPSPKNQFYWLSKLKFHQTIWSSTAFANVQADNQTFASHISALAWESYYIIL